MGKPRRPHACLPLWMSLLVTYQIFEPNKHRQYAPHASECQICFSNDPRREPEGERWSFIIPNEVSEMKSRLMFGRTIIDPLAGTGREPKLLSNQGSEITPWQPADICELNKIA
ncbi:hypothetical protein Pst134EB_016306 [Puccinia striiformis f. sp. tritici]|nr:hypothetical protein Pst134EB_016306 [Puccinia striiformis f. sp. tritici]